MKEKPHKLQLWMKLIECSVCGKQFVDPVSLPRCGHTFCLECIKNQTETCPLCKYDTISSQHKQQNDTTYKPTVNQCLKYLIEQTVIAAQVLKTKHNAKIFMTPSFRKNHSTAEKRKRHGKIKKRRKKRLKKQQEEDYDDSDYEDEIQIKQQRIKQCKLRHLRQIKRQLKRALSAAEKEKLRLEKEIPAAAVLLQQETKEES